MVTAGAEDIPQTKSGAGCCSAHNDPLSQELPGVLQRQRALQTLLPDDLSTSHQAPPLTGFTTYQHHHCGHQASSLGTSGGHLQACPNRSTQTLASMGTLDLTPTRMPRANCASPGSREFTFCARLPGLQSISFSVSSAGPSSSLLVLDVGMTQGSGLLLLHSFPWDSHRGSEFKYQLNVHGFQRAVPPLPNSR